MRKCQSHDYHDALFLFRKCYPFAIASLASSIYVVLPLDNGPPYTLSATLHVISTLSNKKWGNDIVVAVVEWLVIFLIITILSS